MIYDVFEVKHSDDIKEAQQRKERIRELIIHVKNDMGYEILLSTQVTRVQDDVKIAEGHTTVWIPGYL